MKIAIISLYTDEIKDIVKETAANQYHYAKQWGYDYLLYNGRLSDRHPAFDKILITRRLLKDYHWVLWIDSDAVFNKFDRNLEHYIKPQYDGVFGPDPNPNIYVNTGVFLIKNSQWGHTTLDKVWNGGGPKTDVVDPHSYSQWPYEQGKFNQLLQGDQHHYRVDGHEFNSHPNYSGPNTFITHYMGARTTPQRWKETIKTIKELNKALKVPRINLDKVKYVTNDIRKNRS